MKKLLSCLVLLLLASPGYSQHPSLMTVTGAVCDSATSAPVGFATITVVDDQGGIVTAAAAESDGTFKFEHTLPGTITLIISSVGYHDKLIELEADSSGTFYAGTILLSEGVDLEQVNVRALKPLITANADKMTYSVEADPQSETSTLLEIIRKVPQLSVDGDGNVLLNGQSNYKVTVNGRNSSMWSNNFKEVIRSMPASSIRDIEVISTPSTKYEAEGIGGIINIVTNRRNIYGYSGGVSGGISNRNGWNASANLAAQLGKLSLYGWYSKWNYEDPWYDSHSERHFFNSTEPISYYERREKGEYPGNNFYFEASYDIDTFNLITVDFHTFWSHRRIQTISTNSTGSDMQSLVKKYTMETDDRFLYRYFTASFNYQHTFVKPDRLFTFSYQGEGNTHNTRKPSIVDTVSTGRTDRRYARNNSNGSEHTFQLDYYDPVTENHHIESGIKYIFRRNLSDTERSLWENDMWVPDLVTPNNDLDYDQHILGAYAGYLFKPGMFSAKAGLRAEGTWNNGISRSLDGRQNFTNTQFDLIPYVNLAYSISQSQSADIGYTQRLGRPSIWYLNPYVDMSEPGYIHYGNPDLEATLSHNLALNYRVFKPTWNLFVGITGSFVNNGISRVIYTSGPGDPATEGTLISTYANISKQRSMYNYASFSYRLGTRLNFNSTAAMNYIYVSDGMELSNKGTQFFVNASVGVELWKGGLLYTSGYYSSGGIDLQSNYPENWGLSFNLSQKFLGDKLRISAEINDPFWHRKKYLTEFRGTDFSSRSHYYDYTRRFGIRVSYNFGKMNIQVKKAQRGIRNDDKLEGGPGGGGN